MAELINKFASPSSPTDLLTKISCTNLELANPQGSDSRDCSGRYVLMKMKLMFPHRHVEVGLTQQSQE